MTIAWRVQDSVLLRSAQNLPLGLPDTPKRLPDRSERLNSSLELVHVRVRLWVKEERVVSLLQEHVSVWGCQGRQGDVPRRRLKASEEGRSQYG